MEELGNVLDGHILVVEHTDDGLLLRGQPRQDLPHQAGGLLPVQGQLRLGVRAEVRQLGELVIRISQLRKGQQLALVHLLCGHGYGDPPQPGQEGLVGLQLAQVAKGLEIGVL